MNLSIIKPPRIGPDLRVSGRGHFLEAYDGDSGDRVSVQQIEWSREMRFRHSEDDSKEDAWLFGRAREGQKRGCGNNRPTIAVDGLSAARS